MDKLRVTSFLAAGALGVGSMTAGAASVSTVITGQTGLLSDNSAEYLIKGAGNGANTIVEVGDSLRGILSIDNFSSGGPSTAFGAGTTVNELTALFQLEVVGKTNFGGLYSNGGTCLNVVCFEFGASAGFDAELDSLGFGLNAGAMVGFFEDSGNDFNRLIDTGNKAADIAAMEATATNGDAFWAFGDDGSGSFFWGAGANSDDISISSNGTVSANNSFGTFNFGLMLLENVFGPELLTVDCTDTALVTHQVSTCANGQLLAKGAPGSSGAFATAYDSLDDVNFNISVVPEPGSLALLGLGLLGIAGMRRRS